MKTYSKKDLQQWIKTLPEQQRDESLPRKAAELSNRLEHTVLLKSILLAALLILDDEIEVSWDYGAPPELKGKNPHLKL